MMPAYPQILPSTARVKFIEAKRPDMDQVARLLGECEAVNQWANFGPLYTRLAAEYSDHMGLAPGLVLTPCANAGIALEMVTRTLAAGEGRKKLRWIGSAFSFKNLGRGYFSDMRFLDCDANGILDFGALLDLPLDSFDGIIVTNPFGLYGDYERFIRFAEETGKKLVIDNAAGVGRVIPAWPWQVFSLHHTKPYGLGEGGLVLSPDMAAEFLRLLINYDRIPGEPAYWLNNGKISDISCAFLIDRLRQVDDWEPGYLEQRQRVSDLFAGFGLATLLPIEQAPPTNSLPVLMGAPVDDNRLAASARSVDVARQYSPLAALPQAQHIHDQIINFPVHPDLGLLPDADLAADIETLLECRVGD